MLSGKKKVPWLSILVVAASSFGCMHFVTSAGIRVQVVGEGDDLPASCTEVGPIVTKGSGPGPESAHDSAMNQARNRAAEEGATHLRVLERYLNGFTEDLRAVAYKCGDEATGGTAVSASTWELKTERDSMTDDTLVKAFTVGEMLESETPGLTPIVALVCSDAGGTIPTLQVGFDSKYGDSRIGIGYDDGVARVDRLPPHRAAWKSTPAFKFSVFGGDFWSLFDDMNKGKELAVRMRGAQTLVARFPLHGFKVVADEFAARCGRPTEKQKDAASDDSSPQG